MLAKVIDIRQVDDIQHFVRVFDMEKQFEKEYKVDADDTEAWDELGISDEDAIETMLEKYVDGCHFVKYSDKEDAWIIRKLECPEKASIQLASDSSPKGHVIPTLNQVNAEDFPTFLETFNVGKQRFCREYGIKDLDDISDHYDAMKFIIEKYDSGYWVADVSELNDCGFTALQLDPSYINSGDAIQNYSAITIPDYHEIKHPLFYATLETRPESRSLWEVLPDGTIFTFEDMPGNYPRWTVAKFDDINEVYRTARRMLTEGWEIEEEHFENHEKDIFRYKPLSKLSPSEIDDYDYDREEKDYEDWLSGKSSPQIYGAKTFDEGDAEYFDAVLQNLTHQALKGDVGSQEFLSKVIWDGESWESIKEKLEAEGSTWVVWWNDGVGALWRHAQIEPEEIQLSSPDVEVGDLISNEGFESDPYSIFAETAYAVVKEVIPPKKGKGKQLPPNASHMQIFDFVNFKQNIAKVVIYHWSKTKERAIMLAKEGTIQMGDYAKFNFREDAYKVVEKATNEIQLSSPKLRHVAIVALLSAALLYYLYLVVRKRSV